MENREKESGLILFLFGGKPSTSAFSQFFMIPDFIARFRNAAHFLRLSLVSLTTSSRSAALP